MSTKKTKPKSARYGTAEYLKMKKQEVIKQEALMNYKEQLKVYLSFNLKELKEMGSPLYDIVVKKFPNVDEDFTLNEARFVKLFEKVIMESSMKALELTFKLDGSMSDLTSEPDYESITEATKGVK